MSKKFLFVSLSLIFLFLLSKVSFAYDNKTTHPALTDEIVDFYNSFAASENHITAEQKEWIIQGSIEEDIPPRWINHFYDPIRKIGWTGENTGAVPPVVVEAFSTAALSFEKPYSAVEWAKDYWLQEEYSHYGGNHSWKEGLEAYANGDKKEAYLTIGHIIHLLEDMTVPDHTRNDTHAEVVSGLTGDYGSPYENYTRKWNRQTIKSFGIVDELKKENAQRPAYASLDDYLISTADYSNKYFFSKDTINDPVYSNPKIIREDGNFGYGVDENGNEFPLVRIAHTKTNKIYIIDKNDEVILDSYFFHLSRKAVLNGAGIIELFQKQKEDAVVNKEFPQHIVAIDPNFLRAITIPNVSLAGELYRLRNVLQPTANVASQAAQNIFSSISAPLKNLSGSIAGLLASISQNKQNNANNQNPGNENTAQPPAIQENSPRQNISSNIPSSAWNDTEETENNRNLSQENAANAPASENVSERKNQTPIAEMENELQAAAQKVSDLTERAKLLSRKAPAQKEQIETPALKSESGESKTNNKENETHQQIAVNSSGGGGGGVAVVSGGGGNSFSNNADSNSSSATNNSSSANNSSSTENSSSSTSGAENSSSTSSSTVTIGQANHIVISEFLFDAAGSDTGKEFVELYNPTTSTIDLAQWSLKYQEADSTSTTSLASFKTSSHPEDKTNIPAQGFLLVGLNGYDSANYNNKTADVLRTASLPNGDSKIDLILYDDGDSEIDKVSYGSSSITVAGDSLEKKAFFSGCVSAQGGGEFSGNSCDTGADADFEIRAEPNPQNSASLPEPRDAPVADNFQTVYNFHPRINFSWDYSTDAFGSTSTLTYFIYDITSGSSTLIAQSTSTTTSTLSISEVGRDYDFKFKVRDRDGLSSEATSTVKAASFLDNFYFYTDPRATSTYLFDLTINLSRPFWNSTDTNPSNPDKQWKAIVFYFNEDAPEQGILSTDNNLIPNDANFLRPKYPNCSSNGQTEYSRPLLIFPFNQSSCSTGDLSADSFYFRNLEDSRFYIKLASSTSDVSFSPGNFITLAFYDDGGKSGTSGPHLLTLAAVDKTKYYFQNSPPSHQPPTSPQNFQISFDSLHSFLNLSWSSSTDSDTLDSSIIYEVNVSTSSVLSDSGWHSAGGNLSVSPAVVYPNNYKVGLRAADDFSDFSSSTVQDWNFPEGFQPLPFQSDHSQEIIPSADGGQRILSVATATINKVAMWLGSDSYQNSQVYVQVYTDNGGKLGTLLSTSTTVALPGKEDAREAVFTLNSSTTLENGSRYWLVPAVVPGTSGRVVWGGPNSSYPNGSWDNWYNDPGKDAYFYLGQ